MATTNQIDLTDKSVVSEIIGEMNKTEDLDRREHSFNSWQAYSGKAKPFVELAIKQSRPKSWEGYTISDISLSKIVVDKTSKAYKKQPIRSVGEENESEKSRKYQEILDQADAQDQLPYFDTVTNLHKYGLLWVNWRQAEERYQLVTLQPHEFGVVRDKDTGELQAVILNYGGETITGSVNVGGDGEGDLIAENQQDSSAQTRVYAMWSKEHHVVVKEVRKTEQTRDGIKVKVAITYVENPDNPDNINQLGMIPFVWFSKELNPDIPTLSPLFDQTVTFNQLMSEYLTASNIQGTGQMVFKYPERLEGMFTKLTQGLLSAIKLPQSSRGDDRPTEVDYINPNPDLTGQKEAIMTYMTAVLREHGITTGSGISMENFSSGLERAIANANVDDIVMKKQECMVEVERKIFEIISAYEENLFNNTMFSKEELQVTFEKPKIMSTDKEILENIKLKLELRLIDRADAIQILDPNLNDTQAKEKVKMIDKQDLAPTRKPKKVELENEEVKQED